MATVQNNKKKPAAKRQINNAKGNQRSKSKTSGDKRLHNHRIVEDTNKALFQDEIILIATLVISLLLILSNFNLSGTVGEVINSVTFGLFGFLSYLLPFFLFFGVAFYIANRGNRIAMRKLISGISIGIVLTGLIQLIFKEDSAAATIGEYYKTSVEHKNGGGIIGGILCKLLNPLFGTIGSYIILIAFMIIFLMFAK